MDTVYTTTASGKKLWIDFKSGFDGKFDYIVGVCGTGKDTRITIQADQPLKATFCADAGLTLDECTEAYAAYKRQSAVEFEEWKVKNAHIL